MSESLPGLRALTVLVSAATPKPAATPTPALTHASSSDTGLIAALLVVIFLLAAGLVTLLLRRRPGGAAAVHGIQPAPWPRPEPEPAPWLRPEPDRAPRLRPEPEPAPPPRPEPEPVLRPRPVPVPHPSRETLMYLRQRDTLAKTCMEVADQLGDHALVDRLRFGLEEAGYEIVVPTGDRFNPAVHEAVERKPTQDPALDQVVAATVRPGYRLDGQMIRYAKVVVYRASPQPSSRA